MPKQPAGITKSKRIECLRQVMKRWGRLNKNQIDSHMAAQLGVNVSTLARALYRDLEELVNNSELSVDYFSRDGVKLTDYDPETNKNTVAEWYFPEFEGQVIGHAALAKAGGMFLAPKSMIREFRIDNAKGQNNFNSIHIYFGFQQDFFCLSLNIDALPGSIAVGRILPVDGQKAPIEKIRNNFGKRASILLVPVPNVTGTKSLEEPGHFRFEIAKPGLVKVTDLGSTNGTKCFKLTPDEAENLRKQGTLLGAATLSKSWADTPQLRQIPINAEKGGALELPLPILIEASEKFRMMII